MAIALVTGANGFIGSHLVRSLLDRGYDVRCIVRGSSDITSLHGLAAKVFIGDLTQPETLVAAVRDVNVIFHLAAELLVTSLEDFLRANTEGTRNLLTAASDHAASTLTRFLFVSSQAAAGPAEDATPRDESMEMAPIPWYGSSKRDAEEIVGSFSQKMPVTTVRPCAVYGERERDLSQVYEIVEYRLQPKLGLSSKYLVMVYVGDLVEGIIGAAESPASIGQTYFLNHAEVLTAKDVIRITGKAMDKAWGLLLPVPQFTLKLIAPFAEFMHHITRERPKMTRDKAREISQRYWVASADKAQRDFGWTAGHSLLEGMRKTIKWNRDKEMQLRIMPLQTRFLRWFTFVFIGMIVGTLIETTSFIGKFYWFDPAWLAYIVALGGFGLVLGTLAWLLRRSNGLIQFIAGTALVGAVELVNELGLHFWEFAEAWPFGITSPWVRTAVLALPGGIVVLIIRTVARALYKRRRRLG